MADFKTHVTFSSCIGAGYAVVAKGAGFDLETSLVAGGLCGVAGMLPDVDSDSGVPRREALGFAAAIVPMLLIDRFKQFDLAHDQVILLGATLYFCIRFVAADLIGRWSVHRGMWHSIPAVLIFAGLAFLISGPNDTPDAIFVRYLKAGAVGLGALSHLLLDEVYSVDTRGVLPRFKKSFGTAVKFWGKKPWANFSTYAKLVLVIAAIFMDMNFLERLEQRNPELAGRVQGAKERIGQRFAQLPGAARRDSSQSGGFFDATPSNPPAPPSRSGSSPTPVGPPAPAGNPFPSRASAPPPGAEGLAPPQFAPIGLPNQAGPGGFAPNRGFGN